MYALYNSLTLDVAYVGKKVMDACFDSSGELNDRSTQDPLRDELIRRKFILASDDDFEQRRLEQLRKQVAENRIKMLCVILTTECNFACEYCHLRNIKHKEELRGLPKLIDTKLIEKGLKVFAACSSLDNGQKDILLYGGEPLLAKEQIRFLVGYVVRHSREFNGKVNIILITNGSLLDADFAAFLREHDIFVIVSVDGLNAENDRARKTKDGAGTFHFVERAVKILKQQGCKVGLSITVGKHNIDSIQDGMAELLHRFEPLDFGLNSCFHPIAGQENEFQVDSRRAAENLIECFQRARESGYYAEQLFRRIRPFINRTPRLKDCSSCGGRMVLTPYGTIGTCDSFSYTNDYCAQVEGYDLHANEHYHTWKNISPVNNPECLSCPALTVCGGGCRYDAFSQTGKIDGKDRYRCEQAIIILEWLIWDLYQQIMKIRGDAQVIFPHDEERKFLLGNVTLKQEDVPMSISNMYGERTNEKHTRV